MISLFHIFSAYISFNLFKTLCNTFILQLSPLVVIKNLSLQ